MMLLSFTIDTWINSIIRKSQKCACGELHLRYLVPVRSSSDCLMLVPWNQKIIIYKIEWAKTVVHVKSKTGIAATYLLEEPVFLKEDNFQADVWLHVLPVRIMLPPFSQEHNSRSSRDGARSRGVTQKSQRQHRTQ